MLYKYNSLANFPSVKLIKFFFFFFIKVTKGNNVNRLHTKNSTKTSGYFNNNGRKFTLGNIWYLLHLHCYRVNSVVILLKPQNKDADQWHIQRCLLHPCIPPAPIPVGPWQSPSPWQYVIPDPISISSTWETTSSLRRRGPRERSICRKRGWPKWSASSAVVKTQLQSTGKCGDDARQQWRARGNIKQTHPLNFFLPFNETSTP